jgi:quercetin 2,3-dioxygenase
LLAGTQQGHTGPMPLTAPSLLLHLHLPPQGALRLPLTKDFEHGLYGIGGTVALGEAAAAFTRGAFALLSEPVLELRNDSDQPADVLLLGGTPAEQPLYFGGPFVLDSAEALQQAQRDFFAGKMGTLDGVPG